MEDIKFAILSGVVLCLVFASCKGNEPMCSKFPYEEALLEKMIRMELKVEQMENGINKVKNQVKDEISLLKKKERHYEEIIESLSETVKNTLKDVDMTRMKLSNNISEMFSTKVEKIKILADQNEVKFARMSEELRELRNRTTQSEGGLCTGHCPDGWVYFEESCYLFSHETKPFTEAEHYCLQHQAHLVKINNGSEDRFIKSFVSDLKATSHWIGLTDADIEDIWKWRDGTKPSYINWGPGEPNGKKGENCACLYHASQFAWTDVSCANLYMPICELRERDNCADCDEIVG